ncbi:hypothetical protein FDZ74_17760 [bacterium]|nr:MAG: hypothetical protein FDZ74_17760 [bacterium]
MPFRSPRTSKRNLSASHAVPPGRRKRAPCPSIPPARPGPRAPARLPAACENGSPSCCCF